MSTEQDLKNFYNNKALTHIDALDCWKNRQQNNEMHEYIKDIEPMTVNFKTKGKTLVLGCSIGYQVWALKQLGFPTFGCDISKFAIDNAVSQGCIECNIKDLPYVDGEFENTIGTDVMEHIPYEWLEASIAQIKRVTKHAFTARIPYDWQETKWLFKLEDVFSEHMINQDEAWWSNQFRKYFTEQEWSEEIIIQTEDNKFWRYYYYRRKDV